MVMVRGGYSPSKNKLDPGVGGMGGWQTRSRGRKGEGGNGVNIRESSARGGSENKLVPGVGSLPPPPNKLDPGVESKTRLWRARRVQYPAFTWGTWM
jgi:hypothetical protein